MDFSNHVEIQRSICETCSQILLASCSTGERDLAHTSGAVSTERLAKLLSDAGLDIYVRQSTFRKGVQSGCTICKALHESAVNWGVDDRFSKFCLAETSTQLESRQDPRDVSGHADEELIVNYHADTIPNFSARSGRKLEQGRTLDLYDITELQVSPLGAHERDNWASHYDIFALPRRLPHILRILSTVHVKV